MHRLNVIVVAGLFAVAAVLGTSAVLHTVALGRGQTHAADAAVLARTRQLDRFEASLRRALARKPPALPAVPKAAPPAMAPAAAPQVVYRRPPAIVVVRHTHHGDDGYETADREGGGDD